MTTPSTFPFQLPPRLNSTLPSQKTLPCKCFQSFSRKRVSSCIRLSGEEGKDKRGAGGLNRGGGWRRGCKSKFLALTVEAGEVSPVKQGAVEWGQGGVEEQIVAVGRVSDVVSEQVHLQQGLDQIAQHLAVQRDLHPPPPFRFHSLSIYLSF